MRVCFEVANRQCLLMGDDLITSHSATVFDLQRDTLWHFLHRAGARVEM